MGQHYKTERIIAALVAKKGLVSQAAKALGCTPKCIYNRAKQVRAVQEAIDSARDELIDDAELALRSAVLEKQPWAVALVLKTLGKRRGYVERQEVTGEDGAPLFDLAAWKRQRQERLRGIDALEEPDECATADTQG